MTRRPLALLLATASVCVLGLAAAPAAPAATPPIKIVKIYYDPPGSDRGDNASLNAEHVILRNTTSVARVITGYRLRDVAGHTYVLGPTRLVPGGTVTIRTGRGTNTATTRYWQQTGYVWNNTRDTAYLRTGTGALVHQCGYPDTTAAFTTC